MEFMINNYLAMSLLNSYSKRELIEIYMTAGDQELLDVVAIALEAIDIPR